MKLSFLKKLTQLPLNKESDFNVSIDTIISIEESLKLSSLSQFKEKFIGNAI